VINGKAVYRISEKGKAEKKAALEAVQNQETGISGGGDSSDGGGGGGH